MSSAIYALFLDFGMFTMSVSQQVAAQQDRTSMNDDDKRRPIAAEMCDRILRRKVAAERVGLTVRHLERLEAAGRFPKRVKISDRASGWLESEVTRFIAERVAASRAA